FQPFGRFPLGIWRNLANRLDARWHVMRRFLMTVIVYGPFGSRRRPIWSLCCTWNVPGQIISPLAGWRPPPPPPPLLALVRLTKKPFCGFWVLTKPDWWTFTI